MGNICSSLFNLTFEIITSKEQAQLLLKQAENTDFYLKRCNNDTLNYKARINSTYHPNLISLKDKEYADSFVMNIKNQIPTKLLTDLHSIKIVQLMPSADGGMPHTRPGNIICYPDIVQLQSVSTLIHELWHCHQRTYNDYWLKVFQNLGWYKWNGKLPDKLENARRYNPDTLDCPYWIFDNKWVPIPIFKDITRPNVSQVEIWFYDTEKSYHITYIPTKLKLLFPNLPISAYEHPRELTAYLLSDPFKYRNSPGFIHLIKLIGQTAIS